MGLIGRKFIIKIMILLSTMMKWATPRIAKTFLLFVSPIQPSWKQKTPVKYAMRISVFFYFIFFELVAIS